jgi:hypothetical protein
MTFMQVFPQRSVQTTAYSYKRNPNDSSNSIHSFSQSFWSLLGKLDIFTHRMHTEVTDISKYFNNRKQTLYSQGHSA